MHSVALLPSHLQGTATKHIWLCVLFVLGVLCSDSNSSEGEQTKKIITGQLPRVTGASDSSQPYSESKGGLPGESKTSNNSHHYSLVDQKVIAAADADDQSFVLEKSYTLLTPQRTVLYSSKSWASRVPTLKQNNWAQDCENKNIKKIACTADATLAFVTSEGDVYYAEHIGGTRYICHKLGVPFGSQCELAFLGTDNELSIIRDNKTIARFSKEKGISMSTVTEAPKFEASKSFDTKTGDFPLPSSPFRRYWIRTGLDMKGTRFRDSSSIRCQT